MALIAWLLNGDLNNRGVGAVTVTNHGVTLDNTCKTGKGYSFNGNDSYVSLNSSSINKLFNGGSQKFTITAWIYHSDTSQAILFGDYLLSRAQNFSLELSTVHGIGFFWNESNGAIDVYYDNEYKYTFGSYCDMKRRFSTIFNTTISVNKFKAYRDTDKVFKKHFTFKTHKFE